MSDLVGNPEDRFSRVAAHIILFFSTGCPPTSRDGHCSRSMVDVTELSFTGEMVTRTGKTT